MPKFEVYNETINFYFIKMNTPMKLYEIIATIAHSISKMNYLKTEKKLVM